jgi:MFS family permease
MKSPDLLPRFKQLLDPYRGLGPSLWSMFFATIINRSGDFVAPFLALYLTRALGFDAARTGAMVAIVFGASTVGSFVSGRVADAIGRKRALMACQTLAALVNLAVSFHYSASWAPWLIAFGTFFRGGARPLIGAVLTDLAPQARRKEVFGLQYWCINVGGAFGPLVAAALFNSALPWLFRGDAACTLVSVLLIARGVRMPAAGAAEATSLERHDERGALRAFLARPILLAFAGITLASSITYSQTGFGLPLTLSMLFGTDGPRYFGYLMSLNGLVVIVFSVPIARILRYRRPLACMFYSGAFYVLGFALYVLPMGFAGFAAATFVWTIGEIVAAVNMGVFVARHSPANWRASFQSFVGVFGAGGWSLGPLVLGPLIRSGGPVWLWSVTAAGCALWAMACYRVDRWDARIVGIPAGPSARAGS